MKLRIKESVDDFSYRVIEFPSEKANHYLEQDADVSQYLDEVNEHSIGEILVDKDTDKLIAYVFVYDKKYPGFIYNLQVQPEYQGNGFGKILIDDAVKKYGGIDLTVGKDNDRAVKLYLKYGFEIVGDGNDDSEYYMKLKGADIDDN